MSILESGLDLANTTSSVVNVTSNSYYFFTGAKIDRFHALNALVFAQFARASTLVDLNTISWRLSKFPNDLAGRVLTIAAVTGTVCRIIDNPGIDGEATDYLVLLAPVAMTAELMLSEQGQKAYNWLKGKLYRT